MSEEEKGIKRRRKGSSRPRLFTFSFGSGRKKGVAKKGSRAGMGEKRKR